MTGYSSGANELSRITTGFFEDIGFVLKTGWENYIDDYSLPYVVQLTKPTKISNKRFLYDFGQWENQRGSISSRDLNITVISGNLHGFFDETSYNNGTAYGRNDANAWSIRLLILINFMMIMRVPQQH